jgi:aminopeptidase-like protein
MSGNLLMAKIEQAKIEQWGAAMHSLMTELYPICRSITGDGVRQSLRILQNHIPLMIHEVPTGTPVFDWTVPKEWNIRDAYVKNCRGEKVIDFHQSSLHILNYSQPIARRMALAELKEHLYSLPDQPHAIPYRTAYYRESWGFCLAHETLLSLEEGEYEVFIDATLADGHLTYGELIVPGECKETVLLSCHCCHPSLCNDNLSGMVLSTYLAKALIEQQALRPQRYTYRFLFIPGTIGSITWLAQHEEEVDRIKHGLVLACVGDEGIFHYKRSRQGNAAIDRAVVHCLAHRDEPYEVMDFSPYGYDERQYCSPAFNLPVGSLTRTPHGRFPQYHTSDDNPAFVTAAALGASLDMYLAVLDLLEQNRTYYNLSPKGEPQLGRRGLYSAFGGKKDTRASELAMLWVLNFSDGQHSLLDIAEKSGYDFHLIAEVARTLSTHGLLGDIPPVVQAPLV